MKGTKKKTHSNIITFNTPSRIEKGGQVDTSQLYIRCRVVQCCNGCVEFAFYDIILLCTKKLSRMKAYTLLNVLFGNILFLLPLNTNTNTNTVD